MNIPINDNITSGLLSLIYQDGLDNTKPLNILNISCDVSRTYNELKKEYPNSNIYNIEMDSYYENNVENIENTVFGDIKNNKFNYPKVFFDYMLIDDTIEKFVNPNEVLEYLKVYLKVDGFLLISIPNIMHINALHSIINGSFSMQDSGILNKDNLRFFTLNSMQSLIVQSGYNLLAITSVATEPMKELEPIINTLCQIANQNISDQLYSYQYLIKSNLKPIKTLFDYVNS